MITISGVVLINVAIPMLRKQKGSFNYPLYLLHRFLRMIPSLVGFTAFLFFYPLLSSGPIFKRQVNHHMNNCERHWFYNLLFLSNYLWPSEMVSFAFRTFPGISLEQSDTIGLVPFSVPDKSGLLEPTFNCTCSPRSSS
jgi:peptidoglycan/LPS O-acetylase OafA/YrhL